MFCANCGTEIPEHVAFCPACGTATANAEQKHEQPDGYQQTYEEADWQDGVENINVSKSRIVALFDVISMLLAFFALILFCVFLGRGSLSILVVSLCFAACAIVFGTLSKRFNGITTMARVGRIIGIVYLVPWAAYFIFSFVSFLRG